MFNFGKVEVELRIEEGEKLVSGGEVSSVHHSYGYVCGAHGCRLLLSMKQGNKLDEGGTMVPFQLSVVVAFATNSIAQNSFSRLLP